MATLPFTGSMSSGNTPPIGPGPAGVNPEHEEGAAPGPRFAPEVLPVNPLGDSTGAPSRLGGFSASPAHSPLGAPPAGGLDYPKPSGR
jgi:hypothetical protein